MTWDELKNIREGKSLSTTDLGHLADIPGGTIYSWENDAPTWLGRLKSLCEALEVSPNELLGYSICEDDRTKDGTTVVKHQALPQLSEKDLTTILNALKAQSDELHDKLGERRIDMSVVNQINSIEDVIDKVSDIPLGGYPQDEGAFGVNARFKEKFGISDEHFDNDEDEGAAFGVNALFSDSARFGILEKRLSDANSDD